MAILQPCRRCRRRFLGRESCDCPRLGFWGGRACSNDGQMSASAEPNDYMPRAYPHESIGPRRAEVAYSEGSTGRITTARFSGGQKTPVDSLTAVYDLLTTWRWEEHRLGASVCQLRRASTGVVLTCMASGSTLCSFCEKLAEKEACELPCMNRLPAHTHTYTHTHQAKSTQRQGLVRKPPWFRTRGAPGAVSSSSSSTSTAPPFSTTPAPTTITTNTFDDQSKAFCLDPCPPAWYSAVSTSKQKTYQPVAGLPLPPPSLPLNRSLLPPLLPLLLLSTLSPASQHQIGQQQQTQPPSRPVQALPLCPLPLFLPASLLSISTTTTFLPSCVGFHLLG